MLLNTNLKVIRCQIMKFLLSLVFSVPILASSQMTQGIPGETDSSIREINKNIFRAIMGLSTDTKFSVQGGYEREIIKPFTLVFKAGPAFDKEYTMTDAFGTRQYKWSMSFAASGEARYYFNLGRRIKHQKPTRDFSAAYFSFEEMVQSKPVFILNKSSDETLSARSVTYINIGYQREVKQTYYNIFFGTRFPGKIYETSADIFDIIHGGISIGRVF